MATFIETFEQIPEDYKVSMFYIIGSMKDIVEHIKNPYSIFNENAPTNFVDLPLDQQEVMKTLLNKAIEETFFERN